MDVGKIIAHNLKTIREEKRLSQGQLAERAGLSKVIISQIERGDSNPTINTIWKLAGALGLPYTSLIEPQEDDAVSVRAADAVKQRDKGYCVYGYYPKNEKRNFELFLLEMEPNSEHLSVGHSKNSVEYLLLLKGKMQISADGRDYTLEKNDALQFNASGEHRYINLGDQTLKAVMIIQYLL